MSVSGGLPPWGYESLALAARVSVAAADLPEVDHAAAQALIEIAERVDERKPGDNVSLPTFLRLCEALGLTPASRGLLAGAVQRKGRAHGGDGGAGDGAGDGADAGSAPESIKRRRAELKAILGGRG